MEVSKVYRYEEVHYCHCDEWGDVVSSGRVDVQIREFTVIRQTPCGVWISVNSIDSADKFILLTANKRYACPTPEEALESFKARKQRQIKILTAQCEKAKRALACADKITL